MKLTIDTDSQKLTLEQKNQTKEMPLYSKEAFEHISRQWIAVGWDQKYPYTFTWMGRPIIQLPEDMIRAQEVIFKVKPTVIIETGVAHGGSLIYYASLFKVMGQGRIIGVDIEIRPHNRKAIEEHPLSNMITLIEGNSVGPEVLEKVQSQLKPDDRVLVFLDSNHTKDHVLKELNAYHKFVTAGSYIVATDGVMQWVADTARAQKDWTWNNPSEAAFDFVKAHPEFELEQPAWLFNESPLTENVTHWPSAYLRKK
jgi:cephalosporin hydroxylase